MLAYGVSRCDGEGVDGHFEQIGHLHVEQLSPHQQSQGRPGPQLKKTNRQGKKNLGVLFTHSELGRVARPQVAGKESQIAAFQQVFPQKRPQRCFALLSPFLRPTAACPVAWRPVCCRAQQPEAAPHCPAKKHAGEQKCGFWRGSNYSISGLVALHRLHVCGRMARFFTRRDLVRLSGSFCEWLAKRQQHKQV